MAAGRGGVPRGQQVPLHERADRGPPGPVAEPVEQAVEALTGSRPEVPVRAAGGIAVTVPGRIVMADAGRIVVTVPGGIADRAWPHRGLPGGIVVTEPAGQRRQVFVDLRAGFDREVRQHHVAGRALDRHDDDGTGQ